MGLDKWGMTSWWRLTRAWTSETTTGGGGGGWEGEGEEGKKKKNKQINKQTNK